MRMNLICEKCGSGYAVVPSVARKGSRFCSAACRVDVVSEANRRPLAERFWEKVRRAEPTECWEWQAGFFADGYGAISVDGQPRKAHRVSYELNVGPIPKGGHILHACDNTRCVNPRHLRVGDAAANASDKMERGRVSRTCKISDDDVAAIRASTLPVKDIANQYSVSIGLVTAIRGKQGHRAKRQVSMSVRKERALASKASDGAPR